MWATHEGFNEGWTFISHRRTFSVLRTPYSHISYRRVSLCDAAKRLRISNPHQIISYRLLDCVGKPSRDAEMARRHLAPYMQYRHLPPMPPSPDGDRHRYFCLCVCDASRSGMLHRVLLVVRGKWRHGWGATEMTLRRGDASGGSSCDP